MTLDLRPTIAAIVNDLARGRPGRDISAQFHNTLAAAIVEVCTANSESDGLDRVCLSGGTFQNLYLLERTIVQVAALRLRRISARAGARKRRRDRAGAGCDRQRAVAARGMNEELLCVWQYRAKWSKTYDQGGLRMAKVQFGGITREACLEYLPETKAGEYVLVHVGFAISRVDEDEAERTYQALKELDQLTELDSPVVDEVDESSKPIRRQPGSTRPEETRRLKYLDEYRDGDIAGKIVAEMRRIQTRPWVLMEVCGGQTHSIVKNGLDQLLPEGVELVHGPGCPVCVTPLEMIDKAHAIARQPDVIFCSFGDMLRVPGSDGDLFTIKSSGGDVRIVYSPLDCLKIARANPDEADRLLRHRLRDHCPCERHAGLARPRGENG